MQGQKHWSPNAGNCKRTSHSLLWVDLPSQRGLAQANSSRRVWWSQNGRWCAEPIAHKSPFLRHSPLQGLPMPKICKNKTILATKFFAQVGEDDRRVAELKLAVHNQLGQMLQREFVFVFCEFKEVFAAILVWMLHIVEQQPDGFRSCAQIQVFDFILRHSAHFPIAPKWTKFFCVSLNVDFGDAECLRPTALLLLEWPLGGRCWNDSDDRSAAAEVDGFEKEIASTSSCEDFARGEACFLYNSKWSTGIFREWMDGMSQEWELKGICCGFWRVRFLRLNTGEWGGP